MIIILLIILLPMRQFSDRFSAPIFKSIAYTHCPKAKHVEQMLLRRWVQKQNFQSFLKSLITLKSEKKKFKKLN